MDEMKTTTNNQLYCTHCGCAIDEDEFSTVGEDILCPECVSNYCCTCERCGMLMYDDDAYSDEYHCLCESCFGNHYIHCEHCGRIVHNDDAFEYAGSFYCSECYSRKADSIHEYGYKPEPVFYGNGARFFGVELEIDIGGRDDDNADSILEIGNSSDDCIYIKSDGSLNDGMEIVSHPMTLDYHLDYYWEDIMRECVRLGYRSHQTSTCGLHVHVNRTSLGSSEAAQEATISRILYFVETHWNELLKFSRRSKAAMNRWASRYGYESSPKKILDKAKERYGRYSAVNLCNLSTIEFRMFRGTLKLNTFIATLQMVNRICDVAFALSDEEIQGLSWSDFVVAVTEPELIQYLRERRLYVNETINTEEDM